MIVKDIVQRSDQWHAWRKEGISASDAPVLAQRSPYKTPWRLFAEKTGLVVVKDLSRNPNVRRGVLNEGAARTRFEETMDDPDLIGHADESVRQSLAGKCGFSLIPVCGESDANPLMRASFDGLSATGIPVEIKCPATSTFLDVVLLGVESKAYKTYWCQVQHQMYVSGASKGYLYFWYEGFDVSFEIERDDAFIAELLDASMEFFARLKNGIEPAKDPDRDMYIPSGNIDQQKWLEIAVEYRQQDDKLIGYQAEVKRLQAMLDEKERQFLEMMGDYSCGEYAGVRVTQYSARGSVSYKSVVKSLLPALTEAEMEPFRGKAKTGVRVTVRDGELKADVPFDLNAVKDAAVEDCWL